MEKVPEKMSIHPIFREYDISDLARRFGYTELYLVNLKDGQKPITPRFRAYCAAILRRPESELFAPAAEPAAQDAE